MSNQNKFKIVLERIEEAEQLLMIGVEKGSLSSIERDILLEKLRSCYEMLLFDKKDETFSHVTSHDIIQKAEKVKVEPAKEVSSPPVEAIVTPLISPTRKSSSEPVFEIEADEDKEEVSSIDPLTSTLAEENKKTRSEKTEEPESIKNIKHDIDINGKHEKDKSPILAEKFQGKKKFRNEAFGVGKKDMASKLQNKPIQDLTKAIGINDKFLFTKELFNGNAELYAKTILKLNEFTDINDALFFVQDNFSWDDKNEAANQLMELVRRKLLID